MQITRAKKKPPQAEHPAEENMRENRAAQYLGVSAAALRLWRAQQKGPLYYRAGEKLIRYRKVDLDAWIEARLIAPALPAA